MTTQRSEFIAGSGAARPAICPAGEAPPTEPAGAAPLETAPQFLPEIGVLDIGMPGLDGYELARRMPQQPWGKAMVLIALTGWGQENDRRRSRETGFDSRWLRPLDMDDAGAPGDLSPAPVQSGDACSRSEIHSG
jgi:CheY-like chemotaxis protein